MNLRDAAQQALEAMDKATRFMSDSDYVKLNQAIDTLRAALEQPEQEPVAWMTHTNDLMPLVHKTRKSALNWQTQPIPLYTHPPRREWQGMTEEEIQSIHDTYHKRMGPQEFARAIEAALKEKNK